MSNSQHITPLVLTYNESPNIARNLDKLTWAHRIVVIDSFSTDDTMAILKQYPQVEVYQRRFISFADQCNFGLEQIKSDWVLSMDADYILDDEMVKSINELSLNPNQVAAYSARFKYDIFGKPLRGTLYPPRKVLYSKNRAHYVNDGHGHAVIIEGNVGVLGGFIHHDDRKPFSHWLASQDKYLKQESEKLNNTPYKNLKMSDKLRWWIIPAPFIILFYCLIIKKGIFDGKHGWYYAFQRVLAEILLSLRLIESRITIPVTENTTKAIFQIENN